MYNLDALVIPKQLKFLEFLFEYLSSELYDCVNESSPLPTAGTCSA